MARLQLPFQIYDKSVNLQVFSRSGYCESRWLNLSITDKDFVQIKLKDPEDFVFNYTSNIDSRQFEVIKQDQNLDIDFNEFKSNLLEMLQQVHRQELFLKCEQDSSRCFLIFYNKSRIKSLIFLTLELQMTSQKEIFDEMSRSIGEVQILNKSLQGQLQMSKKLLTDKDMEINQIATINRQLERKFQQELQKLGVFFADKLQETSSVLLGRILGLTRRILKLFQDVEMVKSRHQTEHSTLGHLQQTLRNLQLQLAENSTTIEGLKSENQRLKNDYLESQKTTENLHREMSQRDKEFQQLERLKDEFERDVKQATVIIAQKTAANDELAKDLVQANQMLVNFNHIFDAKNTEIRDLQANLATKDQIIHEQNVRFQDLRANFEEYQAKYNLEQHNKMRNELFAATKKIEEIEKLNRETVKLNELLTRKLASGDFHHAHRNFH